KAGAAVVECAGIEHHADGAGRLGEAAEGLTAHERLALVGPRQAGEDAQGGGFAGPVGAEEAGDGPGGAHEAEVVHGGTAAVALVEAAHLEADAGGCGRGRGGHVSRFRRAAGRGQRRGARRCATKVGARILRTAEGADLRRPRGRPGAAPRTATSQEAWWGRVRR